jgi:hypothetical protein
MATTKIVLKNVRIAFAHGIFDANSNGDGEPKFNCAFLFDEANPCNAEIEAAAVEAANNKWGVAKGRTMYEALKKQGKVGPYDGNLKSQYAGYEGMLYLNASNKTRPTLRDRDGKTPLVKADGRPYSGAIVNGIVEFWAQDSQQYGKRINCSLMGVQFVKDAPSFASGSVASEADFEEILEGSDAEDLV